jgi:hypothetical protein
MADRGAHEDPGATGESPVLVAVTIEPGPRRSTSPGQIRRPRRLTPRPRRLTPLIAVIVTALFAAAAVGVVASGGAGTAARPLRAQAARASTPGPVGVAAAYRYPRACLSVTTAEVDPAYAAVRLNRASPCWRYGVYVTAIFQRVAGVWRMVLDTTGAGCPMTSVPPSVLAQLGLCDSESTAWATLATGRALEGLRSHPAQLLGSG